MTSILLDEIHEQPAVMARLLLEQSAAIQRLAGGMRSGDIDRMLIAARGTSDNAARYGQYLFGAHNQLAVALAAPSLFSRFDRVPRLRQTLVMGISQSGQSPDIVAVLSAARRQSAPTVALTNTPGSPLAATADHVIDLCAGVERSVAATKTYTSALGALAMLSVAMGAAELATGLDAAPAALTEALGSSGAARVAAAALAPASRCVVLGRGYNYATAFELSLKVKELTHLLAEPYSIADFMHGPMAVIEPGFPAVVIDVGETFRDEFAELREALRQQKATVIVLTDQPERVQGGEIPVPVPASLPEALTPLAAILPAQLLAFHLAQARGLDPDLPRTIRKVTETR